MSSASLKLYDQAAAWAVKKDLGAMSAAEQEEFEAWLAADIRHIGAYARAEATLARLERLGGIVDEEELLGPIEHPLWTRRRLIVAGGAVAAAGIAIAISNIRQETMYTEIGQLREVILADGSVVSLNTNSEMSVNFDEQARNVTLLRGEALFDVVKDRKRPFIVSAGGTQIRAVGTSFSVSLLDKKPIQVLVKEGVVELRRDDLPDAQPIRAKANVRAIVRPDAPIATVDVPKAEIARELEWQNGRIALDNESLANAADEFARYSDIRIIVDRDVANRTVTGLFSSNDPVGFAKGVALLLKLQTEVKNDQVRIFAG